jgi:hypothetical protein
MSLNNSLTKGADYQYNAEEPAPGSSIRGRGTTHVRTALRYSQSNGEIESWHKSLKSQCIRPGARRTPEAGRRPIQRHVEHYDTVRLNTGVGTILRPIRWKARTIYYARDSKLEKARRQR